MAPASIIQFVGLIDEGTSICLHTCNCKFNIYLYYRGHSSSSPRPMSTPFCICKQGSSASYPYLKVQQIVCTFRWQDESLVFTSLPTQVQRNVLVARRQLFTSLSTSMIHRRVILKGENGIIHILHILVWHSHMNKMRYLTAKTKMYYHGLSQE